MTDILFVYIINPLKGGSFRALYEHDHKEEDRLVLVVAAGGGGDLLVDILANLMRNVTARLNRNIEHNLGLNKNIVIVKAKKYPT